MDNKLIAQILNEVADILELQDVSFKSVAYRRVARLIDMYPESVVSLCAKKGVDGLKELPGVGEHIAEKLEEVIKTGQLQYLEKLKKRIPAGLLDVLHVPGLGPRKTGVLYRELKIKSLNDLKKAIRQKKLRSLAGFGEKSEQNIMKGITLLEQSSDRVSLGVVLSIAEKLVGKIKDNPHVQQIALAGSLARKRETIGDVDILAVASNKEKVMQFFTSLPEVSRILAQGKTKSSVLVNNTLQVDFRLVPRESFGAAMQYFVGSKDHNIQVRRLARKKKWKLNEYGLFDKNGKIVAGVSEKKIYEKLGMQWIPYELRENQGEIQAALEKKLPSLVELKDVKGDLQTHSTWSDGDHSLKQMAEQAIKKGYQYIAATDHANIPVANGLDAKRFKKYSAEIDRLNKTFNKFRMLKSLEVNIKKDGSLDVSSDILKKLDIVVAGIHSHFNLSEKEGTARLKKAIENKYVHVIVHPTARRFGKRTGVLFNSEKVFTHAKANDKWLEINGNPHRMDLSWQLVKKAKNHKLQFTLGTDAHSLTSLDFMKYAVAMARKGWCTKRDIINTLTLNRLSKKL